MRPARSAAVLLLLCTISVAKSPKKSDLNRIITQARYVMVTTYYGNGVANLSTPTQDRRAMLAMEEAFKKWRRYHVVYQPEMADIIVLVRKGRYAGLTGGGTVGVGTGGGVYGGADAGMPDDELAVYDAHLGLDTSPLWRRMQAEGLRVPKLPLFEELKKQVEDTEKADAAKKNHSRDGHAPSLLKSYARSIPPNVSSAFMICAAQPATSSSRSVRSLD